MAWPYIFQSNFERGSFVIGDGWDSETDAEGVLNVRHYSWLSRYNVTDIGPIAPYRGAYVAEWDLVGDTADHVLIEGDIDIADTETGNFRFYLFIGKNFRATADDTFNLFEFQGTANAVETAVGLRVTAASQVIEIGIGETAPSVFATNTLTRGKWYCIEVEATVQVAAAGTGASFLYVDDVEVATIGSLTQTAVLRGVLGTQDTLATTTGHLFMDQVVFDAGASATYIGAEADRFPSVIYVTKSGHICLGESELLNVTLLPGAAATNTLTIFDTDEANVSADGNTVARLYNLTSSEPPIDLADVPVCVKRGAYVRLTTETAGTNAAPRAMIHIGRSQGYGSVGRVRQHGQKRKPHSASQE